MVMDETGNVVEGGRGGLWLLVPSYDGEMSADLFFFANVDE